MAIFYTAILKCSFLTNCTDSRELTEQDLVLYVLILQSSHRTDFLRPRPDTCHFHSSQYRQPSMLYFSINDKKRFQLDYLSIGKYCALGFFFFLLRDVSFRYNLLSSMTYIFRSLVVEFYVNL